jgi:hypothetical protein
MSVRGIAVALALVACSPSAPRNDAAVADVETPDAPRVPVWELCGDCYVVGVRCRTPSMFASCRPTDCTIGCVRYQWEEPTPATCDSVACTCPRPMGNPVCWQRPSD